MVTPEDLADLAESFAAELRAKPKAPADPLRTVLSPGEVDGWPGLVLRASLVGRCDGGCSKGYAPTADGAGYAECRCMARRRLVDRFNVARLPTWADGVRSTWDSAKGGASLDDVRGFAMQLRGGDELGRIWHGQTGRGKSWRAAALALTLVEIGVSVRWAHWPTLLDALRLSYREQSPTDGILRPLRTAEVLFLDDVGAGRSGPWVEEVGESVIGQRAERRAPIVITSNLAVKGRESLPAYLGDRTWSRLCVVASESEILGFDLRAAGARRAPDQIKEAADAPR